MIIEKEKDGIATYYASDRAAWRKWLQLHSINEKSVWLIVYHKGSGTPSVYYDEAVDEALCFGWVDSKPNKRDKASYFQFFSKRNPKSNWSRINKEKVQRLISAGLMAEHGLALIEESKRNGSWNALDQVEKLEIPVDLENAFKHHPNSKLNWDKFPRSIKRGILEWIFNAKKPETRAKRIFETAEKASRNERSNQWR